MQRIIKYDTKLDDGLQINNVRFSRLNVDLHRFGRWSAPIKMRILCKRFPGGSPSSEIRILHTNSSHADTNQVGA